MEAVLPAALMKVGVFVLVQVLVLVYLILAQSSAAFSRTKSLRLRPARSLSARRFVALLSDLPPGGEPSPVAAGTSPVLADQKED